MNELLNDSQTLTASDAHYLAVDTEAKLSDYCQQVIENPQIDWIAIDTEFVRVDTLFPELSLVQIQDCLGQIAIIDPIAIKENAIEHNRPTENSTLLAPLITLLADTTTRKVFHSARQDIEVLYQLGNQLPAAIFDTQIATLFLKHGEMAGFARVVKEELGVEIEKSQTRTNWHARPLTEEQIQYAIDDVRYLAPLYQTCLQKLTAEQLKAVEQDCLDMLDVSLYEHNPATAGSKIKGIKGMRSKQLAIIYSLAAWREQFAVENNQPKKWVMTDEVITHIAKRPPKTVEALYKVPQIKSSSVKGYGAEWIAIIDEVFEQPAEQWPQPEPKPASPTPQEEVQIQLCFAYAQQVALDYKIALHSLIQKHDIYQLMHQLPTEKPVLSGWRKLLIGEPLLAILAGQNILQLQNGQLMLKDA